MKSTRGKVDIIIAISAIALIVIGEVMVFSASSMYAREHYHSIFYFFKRQLLWGGLAILFAIGLSKLDYQRFESEYFSMLAFAGTVILLVGVLIFTRSIKGAHRWYNMGFGSFQPSEVAKLTVIYFLAIKLSARGLEKRTFKQNIVPVFIVLGTILGLILMQPDLSTALLIGLIALCMLFVSRIKLSHLFAGVLPLVPLGIAYLTWRPYHMARIRSWLESFGDPLSASYQVKQSIIAIGRGGMWGNGIGESKQKLFFLPDSHTDFIFSIIGEEFGYIGVTIILILFIVILYHGLKIARKAPDGFGQFLALGVTLNITLYAFMNIAVVTGIVPATGLPLPFISYGGSHMVFMGISLGVLLNISRHIRGAGESGLDNFNLQRDELNSAVIRTQ